jgi:hypothetical protein
MRDDILDDLFLGCAFAAFLDQAAEEGGPPSSEATRKRAYAYYEEELALRNRAKVTRAPDDSITRPPPPHPRPHRAAPVSAASNPRPRSTG